MPPQHIFIAVIASVSLAVGLYVLVMNSRSTVHRAFFIFAAGITAFAVSILLLLTTKNFFYNYTTLIAGHTMVLGMIMLCHVFPNQQQIKRIFWLWLIPFLALYCAIPFGLIIQGAVEGPDGVLTPVNGPLYPAFAITSVSYVIYSLFLLFKKYRRLSGTAKLQMQYLFLGAAVFIGAMFVCNVLLPTLGIAQFNLLGPASSIVFIGLTSYAIVRHQLLDIKVIIQRSIIYSMLLTVVVGFYLVTIYILGITLHVRSDVTILTSAGLTTVLGIFGVRPIETYFRKVTDRLFYKDTYDYTTALHTLSKILNHNIELTALLTHASNELRAILKVGYAHIAVVRRDDAEQATYYGHADERYPAELISFLSESEDIIESAAAPAHAAGPWASITRLRDEEGIAFLMPIRLDGALIGVLLLGEKLSGDRLSRQDSALLKTFCQQAAVALEKARLFHQVTGYAAMLEKKVDERTTQIKQLQEEQRQMMLTISHGLQTPLTIAKGELTSSQRETPLNPQLKKLEAAIDKVSKFIYDLLSLARLESTVPAHRARLDFSALLNDVIEYVSVLLEDNNITLTHAIQPDLGILGDQKEMEDLVINIVSNAVKYIGDGNEKGISISLQREGAMNRLAIQDTGVGIAEEELAHLFTPFFRARTPERGTGLGLKISKRIVERHDGTIRVTSEDRRGTMVIIEIPAA